MEKSRERRRERIGQGLRKSRGRRRKGLNTSGRKILTIRKMKFIVILII